MHKFVYVAQRRSQEFSCELNFRGRAPGPFLWLRHCLLSDNFGVRNIIHCTADSAVYPHCSSNVTINQLCAVAYA